MFAKDLDPQRGDAVQNGCVHGHEGQTQGEVVDSFLKRAGSALTGKQTALAEAEAIHEVIFKSRESEMDRYHDFLTARASSLAFFSR